MPPGPERSSHFRYEAVWRAVARIPRGRVSTYGRIARLAGVPGQARFAGYTLHHLPPGFPAPWHRVVNARGAIAFPEGSRTARRQRSLLEAEGIRFRNDRVPVEKFWP